MANLKNDLANNKQKLTEAEVVNERLRQQLNVSLYETDALGTIWPARYLKVYNMPESNNNYTDGEEMALKIAKEMNVNRTFRM